MKKKNRGKYVHKTVYVHVQMSFTGRYYRDIMLDKFKKSYHKRQFMSGFRHVELLHDNLQRIPLNL